MSLKAFHIFFIAVSILFSFGFGGWAFNEYTSGGSVANLLLAFLGFGSGIGLVFYAVKILKKLKHVSYI